MGGITFPSNMIAAFNKNGYPSKSNAVDCINSANYNSLSFVLGGIDFTLRSETWMYVEEPKK